MTRRNRRFLKKIISTLADKEIVNDDVQNVPRRSARLMERKEKSNGDDTQKGEVETEEF